MNGVFALIGFLIFLLIVLSVLIFVATQFEKTIPENGIIGGCDGTRYGCCPDGMTAKEDPWGSNCVSLPLHTDVRPSTHLLRPHWSQRLTPAIQSLQPAPQQLNPPMQQLNPPMQQLNPPIQQLNPPMQQLNPPMQQLTPPTQRVSGTVSTENSRPMTVGR